LGAKYLEEKKEEKELWENENIGGNWNKVKTNENKCLSHVTND
jgi:hypothetical protein